MTPPGERSIRNISLGRRKGRPAPEESSDHDVSHRRPRPRSSHFWIWVVLVVMLFSGFGLLISTTFAGATVTVYPRAETVTPPAMLVAAPNAPIGTLPYQTVSVSRTASVDVPAQGTRQVSRPASGTIIISNAYSADSQRLIPGTRFESPDGKIYKIRDAVVVPGMSGGKAGTVSATVFAESPGPDYNRSAATTYTLPGFKGKPQFSKFSGRSDAPITGGFIGEEPSVAQNDLTAAKDKLQKQLDSEVRAAAAGVIPEGSVAIPGTLEVSFGELVQKPGEGKTAVLTQTATASGVVVRLSDLAGAIAKQTVEDYAGEGVLFGDAAKLDVKLASSSKKSDGTITLQLSGETTLVWQFDTNALTQALLNKPKTEFESVIRAFEPAIQKADASIRPFWQGSFPRDSAKIKIKIAGE